MNPPDFWTEFPEWYNMNQPTSQKTSKNLLTDLSKTKIIKNLMHALWLFAIFMEYKNNLQHEP